MDEIVKIPKEIEDRFFQLKQTKEYRIVSISSRASKGSIASSKNNYSIKAKKSLYF